MGLNHLDLIVSASGFTITVVPVIDIHPNGIGVIVCATIIS